MNEVFRSRVSVEREGVNCFVFNTEVFPKEFVHDYNCRKHQ